MNSQLTMMLIEQLRSQYQYDMDMADSESDLMRVAQLHEDFGIVWPLDWLKNTNEEIKDRWDKFMEGQTFCELGFYERDVRRFLASFPVVENPLTDKPETD